MLLLPAASGWLLDKQFSECYYSVPLKGGGTLLCEMVPRAH
ncbi:hypothetical protein SPIROBIBN47_310057 [uncultured spirochete]|uniref:Uncharacterized protein n=1 Tax=uncultured spirochete TaxID=156406 RepID=A0A3P3XJY4_9SPIR|nr:hypothetical protein SPIROBIBN47_310057 [uncultured spirochete]